MGQSPEDVRSQAEPGNEIQVSRRSRNVRFFPAIALLIILALLAPASARAKGVRVRAEAEPKRLYRGESIQYSILIEGADPDEDPDLSGWTDFTVSGPNRSDQSSHSIQIINGRITKDVQKRIAFTYQLSPKRNGRIRIPPASVKVGGKVYRTRPIGIEVAEPQEGEDIKLRITLSKDRCYAGEPLVLTLTWYFAVNIQGGQIQFPFFDEEEDFRFDDLPVDAAGKKVYEAPVGPFGIKGVLGRGELDGRPFTTLTFKKVVIPRRPGAFAVDPAVLICEVESGLRRGLMGFMEKGTEKQVVPSNTLSLEVFPLPTEGRPAGFTGLVGEYRVETTAIPTEVNVGDPIILNMEISGPEYLSLVEAPDLSALPRFKEDFKITPETGGGRVDDGKIIFSSTIRATHAGVSEIPPVEIAYFDPAEGRYSTARSRAVPLEVAETKVVTLADAEGIDIGPIGTRIEDAADGIAYNYEDLDVLEDEEFAPLEQVRMPGLLTALILPPLLYAGLVGFQTRRRRLDEDVVGQAYKRAGRKARQDVERAARLTDDSARFYPELAGALTGYIREKLRVGRGHMTSAEAGEALRRAGVSQELLVETKAILETCDAGRFGASGGTRDEREALVKRVQGLMVRLEKAL